MCGKKNIVSVSVTFFNLELYFQDFEKGLLILSVKYGMRVKDIHAKIFEGFKKSMNGIKLTDHILDFGRTIIEFIDGETNSKQVIQHLKEDFGFHLKSELEDQ